MVQNGGAMKKNTIRVTVVSLVLIIGVVGYYTYLSQRSRKVSSEAALSKIQSILSRDLEKDYPPSPKEVMKYFTEIQKCLYSEECTAEELQQLGMQARGLYDEELLTINPVEDYIPRLKAEVDGFHEEKKKIISISLPSSMNVDRFEDDGFEFARLSCTYKVNEKGTPSQMQIVYLLRRDDGKLWKIYGWEMVESAKAPEE